ncbi:MAG: hypothetical protein ACYCW6_15575 [Candidatus Xenobia bacterium]
MRASFETHRALVQLSPTAWGTRSSYHGDEVLVKQDDQGAWHPVDKVDGSVTSDELIGKYGLWRDREVTTGHLWWKQVVRPKDGTPQDDEVRRLHDDAARPHLFEAGDGGYDLAIASSASLTAPNAAGVGFLNEAWMITDHVPMR